MRIRVQPWQLVFLLFLMCAAVIGGVYYIRGRSITSPADLAAYLPIKNSTLVYIDAAAIRNSGLMSLIAGSRAAEELEYQQFVDQTLFDYRQDLDAVAVAIDGDSIYFLLRGRFHWRNLMDYAAKQGGACHNGFCSVAASRPDRFISFYPLHSDLMAMAVSSDKTAAYSLKTANTRLAISVPIQPVWILIPASVLAKPEALPDAVRPFAPVLKGADEVVFALGPRPDGMELSLRVACKDAGAATALLVDLEKTTASLREMSQRQASPSEPGDLAGILTAGSFRREGRLVYGDWPVPRSFIDAVVSTPYKQ